MNSVSTKRIADVLGCTRQAVLTRAKAEKWPAKERGKSLEWIPTGLPNDVLHQLVSSGAAGEITISGASRELSMPSFKQCREKDRTTAQQRAALLSMYRQSGLSVQAFVREYNAGHVSRPLFDSMGQVSAATFYRWLDSWEESRIDGLVPRWFSRAPADEVLSDIAKGYLQYYYLDQRKPSARWAWMKVCEQLPQAPSYQTALRYLKTLPKPYIDYYRIGRSKFEAAHFPYIERDPELYKPMDQLVSDHHCFDFLVEKDGVLFRPWITAVQDYRSAKIVGFCPTVYPSSLSITLAFYIAVRRFGAAKLIHIDNGKDYRSSMLRGGTKKIVTMNEDGIPEEEMVHLQGAFSVFSEDVTYAMPYHGQSKGRMERFFGTTAGFFSKEVSSYVGSNTATRPEDAALFWRALNKQLRRYDVITWENFVMALAKYIDWYNSSWRGDAKGLEGKTPDEVFAELAPPARTVDEETLILAFSRSEVRVVYENGVRIDGVSFYSEKLHPYLGQNVLVKRPLFFKNEVIVTSVRGALIATAKADYFKETGDLAVDNGRVNAERKKVLELVRNSAKGRVKPAESFGFLAQIASEAEDESKKLVACGEADHIAPSAQKRQDDDERGSAFIDLLMEE